MNAFIRYFTKLALAGGIALGAATASHADDKTIRIGFQKYGTLILLKAKGLLEEKLKPQGYTMQLLLDSDGIEACWKRAIEAGCEVVVPLDVMFWGDRWGQLRDPFGILWSMNAPVGKA